MSTISLKNKHNLSAIDIKPSENIKLKISRTKNDNLMKYNNISSYSLKKEKKIKKKSHKDLSAFLFQNNDVDFVRSLNPDKDRDLCDNLLFKEHLINNIGTDDNFDLPEPLLGQKINLPKIKRITINGILDSDKKLNKNKKEAARNIANNQLEKELYHNLKEVRNKYNEIKKKKNELYINFESIMKEINNVNLDLQILKLRNTDSFFNKMLELKSKQLEMERIQREKFELENKFNQKVLSTMNSKIPNLIQGLSMNNIQKEMNNNINSFNNTNESNKDMNNNKQNSGDKNEEKMKKIKSLYLAKKEQEEQKFEKYQTIKKYKDDLKEIDNEINTLNKELIELREKDNNLVEKLMKHYQALLFKGKDTRNEGLIWIIKAIWNLGKNVPMQFIPNFLDFKSIEFLFKLANKSIELESKKKLLNENKRNLNVKLHKLYYFNNNDNNQTEKSTFSKKYFVSHNRRSSFAFKTNLIRRNSVLRNSISQSNFVKSYIHSNADDEEEHNKKEPNTFKQISMIIEKNNKNLEIEKMSGMDDIDNLQIKIKEIESEIENMKSNEIKRIFKEFIANDYQNKYHVSVDVVLAALLGEHTKNIEVNKFAKFKREYFEAIKNLRFFEYGKHNKESN